MSDPWLGEWGGVGFPAGYRYVRIVYRIGTTGNMEGQVQASNYMDFRKPEPVPEVTDEEMESINAEYQAEYTE